MHWIMVDIEADGPCPGLYSMVSLGAVIVEPGLSRSFYAQFRPLFSADWQPEALAVSGHTREECQTFPEPKQGMERLAKWLVSNCGRSRIMFVSDNNGFDWQFVNYYFHRFMGANPFGFSSTNLGSLYKGMVKNTTESFKHLRKTKHTHHPVADSTGNAEALLAMQELGLKLK